LTIKKFRSFCDSLGPSQYNKFSRPPTQHKTTKNPLTLFTTFKIVFPFFTARKHQQGGMKGFFLKEIKKEINEKNSLIFCTFIIIVGCEVKLKNER
jgi:hypothetical protein